MATNWGVIGTAVAGQAGCVPVSLNGYRVYVFPAVPYAVAVVSVLASTACTSGQLNGYTVPVLPLSCQAVVIGSEALVFGGEDLVVGNPVPSLRLDAAGKFRFRWAVRPGVRTISCGVLQASKQGPPVTPYPAMTIKANPAIGVANDVVVTGAASTWATLGPTSLTITNAGGLWVELSHRAIGYQAGVAPCYFDNIIVT